MKKRGVIEVHFNWIFVLIAGAIILFFFISIVNKQREFSEIRSSGTIITNLESILTGAQISTNTINIVDIPKVGIGFECNRYFIGVTHKQTKGDVIFSPNLLKGKKLITWALEWNMPYRVTNFLYLTDPELRYVIVNKPDRPGFKIFNELPKEMNKELIEINRLNTFSDKNNYKVKFIFFDNKEDDVLSKLNEMQDGDVTAIVLMDFTGEDKIPDIGKIEFFQKKGPVWESKGITFYLKKESLFGAIFVADKEMYDCVMKKSFNKLNLVTKIYLNRSSTLVDYYGINNLGCAGVHSSAVTNLRNMEITSEDRINDFPHRLQGLNNMAAMNDYSTNIKNENQRAQLFSCVLIY